MAKKKTRKKNKRKKSVALVVSEVKLTDRQLAIINTPTPAQFIKTRRTRGKNQDGSPKMAQYVEGGYTVAKLNEIFGPLNWNWEIIEHGQSERKLDNTSEGEVWVRGRLAVTDHAKGYKIFKDSFGQHSIYPGVPFGDSLKSASTDALKKAAAQGFGIALDVYWRQLEELPRGEVEKSKNGTVSQEALVADLSKKVKACQNVAQLMEWGRKVNESQLSAKHKDTLNAIIRHRVQELEK